MALAPTHRNGEQALPVSKRRQTLGQLWQVPLFMIGVLALLAAWAAHSFCHESETRTFERKLTAVRQALSASPADARQALALAQELLPLGDRFQRGGEVHFLMGSSQVVLAEEAVDAAEHWQQARTHLEQAERLGVPENVQARLTYRLGKALYQTEADPRKVIAYLRRSVDEAADNPAEGYGMIARAYLRLPVPNLQAALEASKKQLALPGTSDDGLAPARLLHGELLLRLKEPAQARKVLARIGDRAEPELIAKARYLRACSCQAEGLWKEAAGLWNEVLAERHQTNAAPGQIHWYLGRCHRELGQLTEAVKHWEATLESTGPERQAAWFGLAELRVNGATASAAFACYEQALKDVTDPESFANELVDVKEARRTIERGIIRYRELGDFDRSMRLARLYEKLALPGVAAELRGQAADAWANEHTAAQADAEARKHFQEAGEAYEAVASAVPGKPAQNQWLRRSGDRFLQAKDFANAQRVLKKFLDVETVPEQLAEGWYTIAQVYHALYDENSAIASYRKCIEFPGSYAYQARYRLAQVELEQGRLDDAEEALKQNLELMRLTPDDETYKTTLFTLAGLMYKRTNYRAAALRYQEALDRFPADPRAVVARHQLADCYRHLASLENQNLGFVNLTTEAQRHYRDQYRLWLKMAVANYQKLADDLAARQTTTPLTAAEEAILRQADFAIGDCKIDLGQYEDAIRHHEILAARYHHQAEQLQALRQIWRCYWMTREPEKARSIVKQIQGLLPELDDRHFTSQPGRQPRQDWLDWLKWAAKQ